MEIHNNNLDVEKELAEAYYKKNKRKNIILSVTIGMAVFLLYTAFAITDGKIRSNYLIDIRGMGTTANVSLQNGSEKQYEQMKQLNYLDAVGIEKDVINGYTSDGMQQQLVYFDKTAFDKILTPAYTDVCGEYPQNADEIMASENVLEQFGIKAPEVGQHIYINLEMPDGKIEQKQFKISGFYTDYIDISINRSQIYVSKAFLDEMNVSMFPADKILATQNTAENGSDIEQWVYSDIEMEYDSQQVFGENPMVMQQVNGTFGSLPVAVSCGVIVVLCAFMLIYNVCSISMARDIQQYGLLKVIGTTNRQIKRIALRQNIRNTTKGIISGALSGGIAVKIFIPYVLQKLYMRGLGKSDVKSFYIGYMVFSIVIVLITSFQAENAAIKQVVKKPAIEAVRYVGIVEDTKKLRIKSKRNKHESVGLFGIAWRNVTRSRKKLAISIFSILIGMITALVSSVIMTGTDITNQLEQNPNFEVGIMTGIFRYPEKIPQEINDETPIMSDEMIKNLTGVEGIQEDSICKTIGSYAIVRLDQDKALSPRQKSLENNTLTTAFATLQIVDDDYAKKLQKYIVDEKLNIDIDSFMEGKGCILLHHHEMSKILQQEAEDEIGNPIHFYSLSANENPEFDYSDPDNIKKYEKGELECSGYLDFTDEYFPKLQTTSIGNNINYFIMTETAFKKLNLMKKIFDISFDSVEKKNTEINQKLSQIVQNENEKSKDMDTYYLNANYQLLDSEKSRINTTRIMLGALALVISLIGLMNYLNTLLSEYAARKTELAVMQSIGLDRKQLWKMIFMECCYYSIITLAGMMLLGSPVLWGIGALIGKKLVYFKFIYPWKMLISIAIILFFINVIIAMKMYNKSKQHIMINDIII